jgi:geranylgeranyl diphosphate synthase type I
MNEYQEFYQDTFRRLSRKMEALNLSLKEDPNPVLQPVLEAAADLNEGGKMLRGVLVCLGYRMAGREDVETSDELALALEIFQTGVLIHDDIIDRAETRRGKKTIPVRYGESLGRRKIRPVTEEDTLKEVSSSAALCAGDLMLYEAGLRIAEAYHGHEKLGDILSEFDRMVLETIRGELLDVILPYEAQVREEDSLEKSVFDIYRMKTAQYSVVGPLHLGMLLGGADEQEMKTVDSFACDLGIAFQIRDDILGIFADEKKLGKDVGSDISEFKQTLLYSYVKEKDEEEYRNLLQYYGRAFVTKKDLEEVRDIFRRSGALAYAEKKEAECLESAKEKLAEAKFIRGPERAILEGFLEYSAERKK